MDSKNNKKPPVVSDGTGTNENGYSSSGATSESRPESFGERSDGRSSVAGDHSDEAQANAKTAEEEEANDILRAFVADVRPPRTETNPGGYTADNLVDLFVMIGIPATLDDIKAALPASESPLLSDEDVVTAIATIRMAQHIEVSRLVASIDGCIVKLHLPQYILYKLGFEKNNPAMAKAAVVKLDMHIQPKHRLFISIAGVLVVVGALMVVVIALLWVNSTYSHVTSQLRDIQRITQLSAVHLRQSDFDALGTHLQGQTESITSLLSVRDNETETIVVSRASDDVMLLSTIINRSDVLHLFTPMAAALHSLKVIAGGNGGDVLATNSQYSVADSLNAFSVPNITAVLDSWSNVPTLSVFRRFVFQTPTPTQLGFPSSSGPTTPLDTATFNLSPIVQMIYDSDRTAAKRCITTNATVGNACDGGPLFAKGRYIGTSNNNTVALFNLSSSVGGRRGGAISSSSTANYPSFNPATDYEFINAISNSTALIASNASVVRMSRSITSNGSAINGQDILANGSVPLLNSSQTMAGFIDDATAIYFTLYIPSRGITILATATKADMIALRKPDIVAMATQLNAYEQGTTMTTRRGCLVAEINPTTNALTYVTPLTRLVADCYKTTPKTCTAQDDLILRAWQTKQILTSTLISYTGSPMVVAVAPAAFNLLAVINIPVTVVLAEGRDALSNIITQFKLLMPNTSSELMLVVRDADTGVIQPQVPPVYRYQSDCPNKVCSRGPTSSFAAELAMSTKASGWVLQQDYRYQPVIAGYAYLAHLDTGVVIEQSSVDVQEKSLQVILSILNAQNSADGASDETAVVNYAGTPTCETYDRFANCDNAEFCYKHPTDPARYGVIYRSDCKGCLPLPLPLPSEPQYLTTTRCVLEVDGGCSMRNDNIAILPLLYKNEEPRDTKGKDYRGRDVIAVYSYVAAFSAGIILKVDSDEVQRPIINNVIIAVVIAVLIIIIGLVALILFSRTVLNRIEQEWLRYKVLIDSEKEKYANLIKTIVPPRIKRDLEILGRSSLTIPNVALSFVDIINFTESVRDWHVDVIAKFVTYYQYTVRAILHQYQIDRVRFVGDAVFSAAGLTAAETNRRRKGRKDRSGDSGQTGTSGNTNNSGLKGKNAITAGGKNPPSSVKGSFHPGNTTNGAPNPVNNNNFSSSESEGSVAAGNDTSANSPNGTRLNRQSLGKGGSQNAIGHKRSNSVQSNESEIAAAEGSPEISYEMKRMGRRPPIFRQACYAAALIETFGPRFAHFPETVEDVEMMFSNVTAEHGAVFPNVLALKNVNPEEVGSAIMPNMRIGIHNGPATFSMLEIGNTPSFDMFGPSVALAKRMEATCTANRIHLTEQAKEALEAADTEMAFTFDAPRKTAVKGIGTINSYFVASADIAIPDELLRRMKVQHAVRRVYHEDFANNGGGGAGGPPQGAVYRPSNDNGVHEGEFEN